MGVVHPLYSYPDCPNPGKKNYWIQPLYPYLDYPNPGQKFSGFSPSIWIKSPSYQSYLRPLQPTTATEIPDTNRYLLQRYQQLLQSHQHSQARMLFQGLTGGKLPEGETMGLYLTPHFSPGASPSSQKAFLLVLLSL